MKISLVVPCYNEENNIFPMYLEIKKVFENSAYSFETVFVDDGSRDKTYGELKKLYEGFGDDNIRIIRFSRNFGKESAILAGLKNATGDYVTIIDADLQQRPEIALSMADFLEEHEEYDSVAAYQQNRKENKTLSLFKKCFYKTINRISETEFVDGASDFRTFRRNVVESILSVTEYHRFSKGIFSWVGFETYYMPYTVEERLNGESKWSFLKLFKYALDGIVAFTTFPLKLATFLGITTALIALIYAVVVVIQKLFFEIAVPGYATIVVLILLLGGLQLFALGILGEYISKIYIQVKNRPVYIVKEVLECGKNKETSSDK